jgi:hypothetical protein
VRCDLTRAAEKHEQAKIPGGILLDDEVLVITAIALLYT